MSGAFLAISPRLLYFQTHSARHLKKPSATLLVATRAGTAWETSSSRLYVFLPCTLTPCSRSSFERSHLVSQIPELERLYRQYIISHPTALNHLQELPKTPAIRGYFTSTQTITSSLSHAWDLPSLLIKPVQRLSQYPNLLTAIVDETPDSHPDKQNLRDAQKRMEEVIRDVNEARRRAEVVRHVLMSKETKPAGPNVLLSANLIKVKSLTVGGASMKSTDPKDETEEAMLIRHLERELQAIEQFVQKFARGIVEWARTTSNTTVTLHTWALDFAKVIGLSADQGSDAFDAFFHLIERKLMSLCIDLEAVINDRVVKELARLLMIMTQPLKLLRAMKELEPYHHHLISMPVSAKSKPPPSLLAASTNYLALRGQLAAELPTYVTLLHKGLKILNLRLSAIQTEFWGKLRGEWVVLWEVLRVEGELNVGAEETVNVWLARWLEVHDYLISLSITQNRKFYAKSTPTSYKNVTEMPSTLTNEGPDAFTTPLFPSVPSPLPIKADSPKIRRRGGSEALAKIAIMQGQTTDQTLALDPAQEPELRGEEREPSPTQPTLSPRNSASSFAPSFASSLSSAARQVMDEAALSATIMYMLGTVEPLSFLGSDAFRPPTPGADSSRGSWDVPSYRSSLSNTEADSVGGVDGEGK